MKKSIIAFTILFCLCFFLVTGNATEILDEWTEVQWKPDNPVAFEKHGSFMIISAQGSQGEQWGAVQKYENPVIGIYGSVYLHAASGNVQSGFSKYMGETASGNLIQAQIYLEKYNEHLRIKYHVREGFLDDDNNWSILRDIASGALGNWDGDYSTSDIAIIGFALVENQIWFYTPKNESIIICQLLFDFNPIDTPYQIFSWAENGNENSIVTAIFDVTTF